MLFWQSPCPCGVYVEKEQIIIISIIVLVFTGTEAPKLLCCSSDSVDTKARKEKDRLMNRQREQQHAGNTAFSGRSCLLTNE